MKLLTSTELAAELGVVSKTLEEWARDNKVPAIRLPSGAPRFDRATVMRHLANRTQRLAEEVAK